MRWSTARRVWTYRELDERSNRLARELIECGAGPETVVGFVLRRSLESVLAIWAIAKTGAAYMPVDPRYPLDRIAEMVQDSRAVAVVTVGEHTDRLPAGVQAVVLDDARPRPQWTAVRRPYRGGRAGRPGARRQHSRTSSTRRVRPVSRRACVVTHRGFATFLTDIVQRYGATNESRLLHVTPPNFDASVCGVALRVLVSGATLVDRPRGRLRRLKNLPNWSARSGDRDDQTPTALGHRGSHGSREAARAVMVGGDVCTPRADLAVGRRGGPSTTRTVPPRRPWSRPAPSRWWPGEPVTIGAPMAGVSALVLDARLRPVPAGVPGELYLAGPAGPRLPRPARPDRRAVRRRPVRRSGERMYRTGDVVRWTPAGELEYIGRSDFQVKVRGLRIELGEIEACSANCPSVDRRHHRAHDPAGGPRAGGVRAADGRPRTGPHAAHAARGSEAARTHGAVDLVVLDEIPMTPTASSTVRHCPSRYSSCHGEFRRAAQSGRGGHRGRLRGRPRSRAGRSSTTDFFDLGGNSLVATRVVARVRAALGSESVCGRSSTRPPWRRSPHCGRCAPGRTDRPELTARPRPRADPAVARAAADVVPQPVRHRVGRLQHPAGAPADRRAGRRRPWRRRCGTCWNGTSRCAPCSPPTPPAARTRWCWGSPQVAAGLAPVSVDRGRADRAGRGVRRPRLRRHHRGAGTGRAVANSAPTAVLLMVVHHISADGCVDGTAGP